MIDFYSSAKFIDTYSMHKNLFRPQLQKNKNNKKKRVMTVGSKNHNSKLKIKSFINT